MLHDLCFYTMLRILIRKRKYKHRSLYTIILYRPTRNARSKGLPSHPSPVGNEGTPFSSHSPVGNEGTPLPLFLPCVVKRSNTRLNWWMKRITTNKTVEIHYPITRVEESERDSLSCLERLICCLNTISWQKWGERRKVKGQHSCWLGRITMTTTGDTMWHCGEQQKQERTRNRIVRYTLKDQARENKITHLVQ